MSNGLGRGLSSLIPNINNTKKNDQELSNESSDDYSKNGVLEVEIEKIKANPMQPRKRFVDFQLEELAKSIKDHGIIQPLVVTKNNDGFQLIAGERRLRASKIAGLKKVPIVIREADDQEKLELALIENIQREDLNPIDLGKAYKQLIDEFNITQEQVAEKVGKSRSTVTNILRMLKLPEEIQLALISEKISEGHAKYLVGLESETKQLNLFRKILHNDLTITDTNKEIRRMGGTKSARIKINYTDKDKEFALREFFGAKIEIKRMGRGGKIIIDFYSDEELIEIIKKVK